MSIEYEIRVLEIDVCEIKKKLDDLGARKIGEFDYRRFIYDVESVALYSFCRLRTNGVETTLALKEVCHSEVGGTYEYETKVDDFDTMHTILNKLGYNHIRYIETKRCSYILDDMAIDIDTWPTVPTFLEIEGKCKKDVYWMANKLGYSKQDILEMGVVEFHKCIYNINILEHNEIKWNMEFGGYD